MNLNLSEKLKTGLTPQEKIDCYNSAIEGIEYGDAGICYELMHSFIQWDRVTFEVIAFLFPEYAKLKKKGAAFYDFWLNSTEERIQVLNKLIEDQKKLL